MNSFEKEVVITAMRHMLRGTHFSICDLDKIIKITEVIPNAKDYLALSALHCVSWSEMSFELRKQVLEKILSIVSTEGFNLSELEIYFNTDKQVFDVVLQK